MRRAKQRTFIKICVRAHWYEVHWTFYKCFHIQHSRGSPQMLMRYSFVFISRYLVILHHFGENTATMDFKGYLYCAWDYAVAKIPSNVFNSDNIAQKRHNEWIVIRPENNHELINGQSNFILSVMSFETNINSTSFVQSVLVNFTGRCSEHFFNVTRIAPSKINMSNCNENWCLGQACSVME